MDSPDGIDLLGTFAVNIALSPFESSAHRAIDGRGGFSARGPRGGEEYDGDARLRTLSYVRHETRAEISILGFQHLYLWTGSTGPTSAKSSWRREYDLYVSRSRLFGSRANTVHIPLKWL